ncbi:unnamed protein product [Paramecium octaurelia]|uniref:Transmembrane protein n=1 Tax=Paramecium octaurelia TaxID=43137 RepID=A0A8S1X9G2_PAROT|nr:unnamed protein product [Paramecium octaurelia]
MENIYNNFYVNSINLQLNHEIKIKEQRRLKQNLKISYKIDFLVIYEQITLIYSIICYFLNLKNILIQKNHLEEFISIINYKS